MVVHLRVHLHQDHRAAVPHRIAQALADQHHLLQDLHLLVHNLAKIVQPAVVALTAPVQPVKFLKVVKSAIHAGFVQHRKNAINHVSVHVSLSQIFLKMSQVKNLKRAFAQSC
jgi:hypothetical protein